MKIDAHQHFWLFDPVRDAWIDDSMKILQNDFMPDDLKPLLEQSGFDGCVAVQADQSEKETRFLLNLADEFTFIKGVVGWVDLKASNLEQRLEHFSQFPKLKGFRHIIQAEPDGFMENPQFVEGVKKLHKFHFTYDILIFEHQLEECINFVKSLPEMPLVIDHLAKPDIKNRSFDDWAERMKKLAEFPNVHVKLSGLVTEADWKNWTKEDFTPYLETCLDYFGAERLMIGSDWPVCLLGGSYDEVTGIVDEFARGLSQAGYAEIMGQSAINFYNLK
jgi:L-fuconolactonase